MKSQKLFLLLFLSMCVVFPGCLKVFQDIKLNPDLSGTVTLKIQYDIDSIATIVAQMQSKGKKVSPEQLAMMKAQMKVNVKTQLTQKMKLEQKEELQKKMPEGTRIEEMKVYEEGEKLIVLVKFYFDHVSKLPKLKDVEFQKKQRRNARKKNNQMGNWKVNVQGDVVELIQPINAKAPKGPQSAQTKAMLKNMGVFYSIEVPAGCKVLKHNAAKQKGNLLIWDYSLEELQTGKIRSIHVKFQK